MCRQIPEELGATWAAISGTKRGNDAIRKPAWKMKEPGIGRIRCKKDSLYDTEGEHLHALRSGSQRSLQSKITYVNRLVELPRALVHQGKERTVQ